MRIDDKVFLCLITYLNAFDGEMTYQLRDKEPKICRDDLRIVVNIETILRILGKLGSKRDDPKIFGNKGNKKEENKPTRDKKQEPTKMSQILNVIKGFKCTSS